jgi:hypothetical protein
MKNTPSFVYAAVPSPATQFIDLFSDGPVKQLLEKPDGLRYAGWDLQTLDSARIVEGDYLEVRNGDRKILNLYENGIFLARAEATGNMLAWATAKDEGKEIKLNPLAIVEFTYSFVKLYSQFAPHLNPQPTSITYRIQIENAKGEQPLLMCPYGVDAINFQYPPQYDRHIAPSDKVQKEITATLTETQNNPARVAYQVVEKIYTWFGLKIEEIPYTKTENGLKEIDVALVAAGGKKDTK